MIETTQFRAVAGMTDLGNGQPQLELLPHDQLARAAALRLTGNDNACLNYGPAHGDGYFRLALAHFLSTGYGFPVEPESLMATGGASQALDLLVRAFASPGDVVLVEEPTYFLAKQIFLDCGLQVVGVPIGDNGLEPDVLEAAIAQHRPRLLYTIPVYQNPSGVSLAAESRQAVVEMCADKGVLILADEVYQLLSYQGDPPPPLAAWTSSEAVISLGSFSKILAPGLRLGWIQAAPSRLERLTSLGIFASGGGLNHFTGCLVEKVLSQGWQASYLESLRQTYRQRIDLMDSLLQEHLAGKVEYRKPRGGYFFWLRLTEHRDAEALLPRALKAKVNFRAGSRFSASGGLKEYLRLSFTFYDEATLASGIERLAGVLG